MTVLIKYGTAIKTNESRLCVGALSKRGLMSTERPLVKTFDVREDC